MQRQIRIPEEQCVGRGFAPYELVDQGSQQQKYAVDLTAWAKAISKSLKKNEVQI